MNIIEKYKIKYQGVFNGPVEPQKVSTFLDSYHITDKIYRNWLIETNGGPISSNWYDSLDELVLSQKKLSSESWIIKGFVIGWDGSGNPIVIQSDNTIAIEDHDFGGIHQIANNFKELLIKGTCT